MAIQLGLIAGFFALAACSPEEANNAGQSPTSPSAASPEHSQENLAVAFAASGSVLFEAKTPADVLKFTALQQVTLAQDPAGLAITATGNDPSVFVPEFPPKPCVVKIELNSPAETVLQVFYLVGGQTVYGEANSAIQAVHPGDNTVYLRIAAAGLTGRWRLDPGGVPGTYLLKSFEVRALEAPNAP